jgi:hypothetical protein
MWRLLLLLRTSEVHFWYSSAFTRSSSPATVTLRACSWTSRAAAPSGPVRRTYQRWRYALPALVPILRNQRSCLENQRSALRCALAPYSLQPKNAYVRIVIIPLLPRGLGTAGARWATVLPYIGILGARALSHSCPAALSAQHGMRWGVPRFKLLQLGLAQGCTGTLLELWGTIQHQAGAASSRRTN